MKYTKISFLLAAIFAVPYVGAQDIPDRTVISDVQEVQGGYITILAKRAIKHS